MMNSLKNIWIFAALFPYLSSFVLGQCFSDNDEIPQGIAAKDVTDLSAGSTQFALELLKNVLPSNGGPWDNIFISPISAWSVLLLTYMGSRGQTKVQMENVLGTGSTRQIIVNNAYQDMKKQLQHEATESSNYTFHMANKIYFDKKFQLRSCMINHFQSEVEEKDFKQEPELSRQTINNWAENQTNNKIKELLPKDSIDPNTTAMVLVNAVYFKAFWSRKFQLWSTKKEDFFVSSTITTRVDMMNVMATFPLLRNSSLQFSAIELPYSGDEVSMLIILPDKGTKVEDLMPQLTSETLQSIYDTMTDTSVRLSLPKFKNEQSMNLLKNIEGMGIKDLFDEYKADLSGFIGKKGLFAQFLQHKTFIEIDEEGTEATAATFVLINKGRSSISPLPETFVVDRPFILMIRNKPTNTILFIGLMRNPKK